MQITISIVRLKDQTVLVTNTVTVSQPGDLQQAYSNVVTMFRRQNPGVSLFDDYQITFS